MHRFGILLGGGWGSGVCLLRCVSPQPMVQSLMCYAVEKVNPVRDLYRIQAAES